MNAGQLIKVLQSVPEDTEVKFERWNNDYDDMDILDIGNVVHIENNVLLLSEE